MSKTLRSEIDRVARTLWEGFADPEKIMPSKVEAIITYVETTLYPVADRINETATRRMYLDDIDRIQYSAEQFLEAWDSAGDLNENSFISQLAEAHKTLAGVSTLKDKVRLSQIVSEELTESRHTRRKLREAPVLQPGNIEKLANDSVDVALDSYFKQSAETLGLTGGANKERSEDGEGQQDFSVVDFASDIANLVERAVELIDLDGTMARRAYNYVSENHGPDAAENFKQVLEGNFQIYIEPQPDMEGERNAMRPAAVGAGAGSGGEAATGGGGGEGGAP
jgi:hypothetical protein